jgi:hypothetical protein
MLFLLPCRKRNKKTVSALLASLLFTSALRPRKPKPFAPWAHFRVSASITQKQHLLKRLWLLKETPVAAVSPRKTELLLKPVQLAALLTQSFKNQMKRRKTLYCLSEASL